MLDNSATIGKKMLNSLVYCYGFKEGSISVSYSSGIIAYRSSVTRHLEPVRETREREAGHDLAGAAGRRAHLFTCCAAKPHKHTQRLALYPEQRNRGSYL